MCESVERKVSVFYFHWETLLQLTLARDFKEDVQIGKNIMSPLCWEYTKPGPHKIKALVLSPKAVPSIPFMTL